MLLDTININDLCELLQVLELIEIEQLGAMAKHQNRDDNVGGWGCELLDLCCDVGLFILNGRMPGDESGSSLAWQMGGATLLIILFVHM
jgi:hypothetical protein